MILMKKDKTLFQVLLYYQYNELSEHRAQGKSEDKTDLIIRERMCSYAGADTLTIYHNAK